MTDQSADQAAKQRDEAEKKRGDEARKRLADERKTREEASSKSGKAAGDVKPTPTQEENDLAAMGVHVLDKEPDGSEEQPSPAEQMEHKTTKQMEARPQRQQGYQTKEAKPAT